MPPGVSETGVTPAPSLSRPAGWIWRPSAARPEPLVAASFTAPRGRASFHAVRPSTLGIVGLGAIGGSLALQAKRAGITRVLGWSPEPTERVAAVHQGAIDDAPPLAA